MIGDKVPCVAERASFILKLGMRVYCQTATWSLFNPQWKPSVMSPLALTPDSDGRISAYLGEEHVYYFWSDESPTASFQPGARNPADPLRVSFQFKGLDQLIVGNVCYLLRLERV